MATMIGFMLDIPVKNSDVSNEKPELSDFHSYGHLSVITGYWWDYVVSDIL